MTTTTDPEQGAEETWTYLGRRVGAKDKIQFHWRDAAAELLVFDELKGQVVGARYVLNVSRSDTGVRAFSGTLRFYDSQPEPADLADLRLADQAAHVSDTARKREAKAKRENNDIGTLTLAQARDMVVGRKAGPSSTAALAQVLRYLTTPARG